MHFRPIGFILGYLIAALGALMSIPTVAALRAGDGETTNMVAALCVTVFVAGLLILGFRPDKIELDRRQGFVLTSMAWVGLPLFGALPLYW
ncbi:MAG: potassium transporter TrkH, partial [Alphaproteobacteria bacterium]